MFVLFGLAFEGEWKFSFADHAGGDVGDACEFINTCKPGLTCGEGSFVPGGESSARFTPYCDVTDPVCPVESECSGIWDQGTAPPGLKDLGWCIDAAAE